MELSRTERHVLKDMVFICHVEHPHKFISNYLSSLGTPPELRQEDWNLANDRKFQSSPLNADASVSKAPSIAANEGCESKGMSVKVGIDKVKKVKKSDDESKCAPSEGEAKQEPMLKSRSERRTEASGVDKSKERERERDRIKARDRDRSRDSNCDSDGDTDKVKDRSYRGHTEKLRPPSHRGRNNYGYSSREKDRHRHLSILEGVNARVYSKQKT